MIVSEDGYIFRGMFVSLLQIGYENKVSPSFISVCELERDIVLFRNKNVGHTIVLVDKNGDS